MQPYCVIEVHVLIQLDHKQECVSCWQARSVEETCTKSRGVNLFCSSHSSGLNIVLLVIEEQAFEEAQTVEWLSITLAYMGLYQRETRPRRE